MCYAGGVFLPRSRLRSISPSACGAGGAAASPPGSSDVRKLVVEFGGAQGEACEGGWGGHVRVRREGGLELVRVVRVARLKVGVDGWGGEEPVRRSGVSGVVGVGANAQSHLVN